MANCRSGNTLQVFITNVGKFYYYIKIFAVFETILNIIMKKVYIILDAMSTGDIPNVKHYLEQFNDPNYQFTMSNHYFEYESQQLNQYDLKYMLIDTNFTTRFHAGSEYQTELKRRVVSAHKMGFKIVLYNLWENHQHQSHSNIASLLEQCEIETYHTLCGGRSYFWWMMYNLYNNWDHTFNHNHKPFDFLYLNKRPREARQYLYKLLKGNTLDHSLYTWWDDNHRIKLPEQYELPQHSKEYPRMGLDQTIHPLPYEHSKINVATETVTERTNKPFITEKIWKPIICYQPFVVLGYCHYLKDLKSMGFKTFDSVWDESYDNIIDTYQRADSIAELMQKIKNIDSDALYEQTDSIRKHNRDRFFNREIMCDVITQDIKLAFEIY